MKATLRDFQECRVCKVVKKYSDFYIRKDSGKPRTECKECRLSKNKEWASSNPEKTRAYKAEWQKRNPENLKSRKKAYRERHPIGYRRWNIENPEKVREINRTYNKRNKHRNAASSAMRRAIKKMATPKWADHEEIRNIYIEAQYHQMEVDHIVPLSSPYVCGLHWEGNLQLLTMKENRSKANKLMPGVTEI